MAAKDDQLARNCGIDVEQLSPATIREQWLVATGTPPPRYISKNLLMRILADRIQTAKYGGLTAETRRRLLKIAAASLKSQPERSKQAIEAPTPKLRPGSVLVRDWQGSRHQVMVIDTGFAFEGQTYRSLSEVARRITGTRWSGPAFFGLRAKRKVESPAERSLGVIP